MRIRIYGSRGSAPVCRAGVRRHGGNTTCLRVLSRCLPPGTALLVDAGSGMLDASRDLTQEGVHQILLLMTHYHHDHTQGFATSRVTHAPSVRIEVFGPLMNGWGPMQVLETLMSPPCFPVSFSTLRDRVQGRGIAKMASQVLVVHPEAGWDWLPLERYSRCESVGLVSLGAGEVPLDRCLRVRTMQTSHPEYTISYRFEEGPTGRVAVLLTDHEASDEVPEELLAHLSGAHLLLQDAQYTRQAWKNHFIGYGHGTGDFAARVLSRTRVPRLGLTHHDPEADDDDVDRILREATETLRDLGTPELQDHLFTVHDLQEVEV